MRGRLNITIFSPRDILTTILSDFFEVSLA